MSLKQQFHSEWNKLKPMSFSQKASYIWDYYKLHIFMLILIVIIGSSMVSALFINNKDTQLSIALINNRTPQDSYEYLETGFWEYLGSQEDGQISVDTSMHISLDGTQAQLSYASTAKIAARLSAGDLDVIIADPAIIDHYGFLGAFADLKTILPQKLYEQLDAELYQITPEDGEAYYGGLSLDHTDFAEKTGTNIEQPVLAIISNTTHTDESLALIQYLFHIPAETQD